MLLILAKNKTIVQKSSNRFLQRSSTSRPLESRWNIRGAVGDQKQHSPKPICEAWSNLSKKTNTSLKLKLRLKHYYIHLQFSLYIKNSTRKAQSIEKIASRLVSHQILSHKI